VAKIVSDSYNRGWNDYVAGRTYSFCRHCDTGVGQCRVTHSDKAMRNYRLGWDNAKKKWG